MNNKTVKEINDLIFEKIDTTYISLTTIAKLKSGDMYKELITLWLSDRDTIEFLGSWEKEFNKDFDVKGYEEILSNLYSKTFVITSEEWIDKTRALGFYIKRGRYGGLFAIREIAYQFAMWVSNSFSYCAIKRMVRYEINNLEENKEREAIKATIRINNRILKNAIGEYLIIAPVITETLSFRTEIEFLYKIVFGISNKVWVSEHPNKDILDNKPIDDIVALASLITFDAIYISNGLNRTERQEKLKEDLESLLRFVK